MKNKNNDISLELQDMALEIMDALCVALHFAGVKEDRIEDALEEYIKELDQFDENAAYGQKEMIAIIKSLKIKKPDLF